MENKWVDSYSLDDLREKCARMALDLEGLDVRPFKKDRMIFQHTLKYSKDEMELLRMHDRLETKLYQLLMDKLSEGL